MATITITVPDAVAPRVLNAICGLHGYRETVPDLSTPDTPVMVPNPQTKAQFTRQIVAAYVLEQVREYEGNAARQVAADGVATEIAIT